MSFSCNWHFAVPWTVARQAPSPWDFPGKNTGAGCHFLLQGFFPTQGSNLCLLHCRQILYLWATGGILRVCVCVCVCVRVHACVSLSILLEGFFFSFTRLEITANVLEWNSIHFFLCPVVVVNLWSHGICYYLSTRYVLFLTFNSYIIADFTIFTL